MNNLVRRFFFSFWQGSCRRTNRRAGVFDGGTRRPVVRTNCSSELGRHEFGHALPSECGVRHFRYFPVCFGTRRRTPPTKFRQPTYVMLQFGDECGRTPADPRGRPPFRLPRVPSKDRQGRSLSVGRRCVVGPLSKRSRLAGARAKGVFYKIFFIASPYGLWTPKIFAEPWSRNEYCRKERAARNCRYEFT